MDLFFFKIGFMDLFFRIRLTAGKQGKEGAWKVANQTTNLCYSSQFQSHRFVHSVPKTRRSAQLTCRKQVRKNCYKNFAPFLPIRIYLTKSIGEENTHEEGHTNSVL